RLVAAIVPAALVHHLAIKLAAGPLDAGPQNRVGQATRESWPLREVRRRARQREPVHRVDRQKRELRTTEQRRVAILLAECVLGDPAAHAEQQDLDDGVSYIFCHRLLSCRADRRSLRTPITMSREDAEPERDEADRCMAKRAHGKTAARIADVTIASLPHSSARSCPGRAVGFSW